MQALWCSSCLLYLHQAKCITTSLMVLSSQPSIQKGHWPVSCWFTLLGKGLETTLMETERKILCVGDCMDAKLVLVEVSNLWGKEILSGSRRSICSYLLSNSTRRLKSRESECGSVVSASFPRSRHEPQWSIFSTGAQFFLSIYHNIHKVLKLWTPRQLKFSGFSSTQ